jgi:Flp pilus assembly protein TadG
MSRSPHSHRDDRGVVALEFVVALPMIVALIVTIITLAGLFQTKSRVVGAARDGARALAIKPGASPNPDTNATDGITVVLEGAACPALTNPAYQTATPPQVTAKASKVYTVTVPLVGSWTRDVIERAKMPCG